MPAAKKKTEATQPEAPAPLKPAEPPTSEVTVDPALAKAHADAVQNLQLNCQEVTFRISQLPSSRKVAEHHKETMVQSVGGKKKRAFSASKRIFDTAHPAVKDLNFQVRQLEAWRDSFTIVKAANLVDEETEQGQRTTIVSGVRLIRVADIAEFDKGVMDHSERIAQAVAVVQECLDKGRKFEDKVWPSIKEWDRECLGDVFNSDDYPTDVTKVVGVSTPEYREYHLSVSWPPAIYERAKAQLYDTLNGTMEAAATQLTTTMTDSFATLANQLVNRVRVHPKDPTVAATYDNAEVMEQRQGPDGLLRIKLRYKVQDPEDKTHQLSKIIELDPLTEEQFKTLWRPQATDEKKKITDSVIDGLMKKLDDFKRLKNMLGEHGTKIDTALDKIRDIMVSAGKEASDVSKEIKNSNYFRAKLGDTLEAVTSDLAEVAVEVKKARRNFNFVALAKGE